MKTLSSAMLAALQSSVATLCFLLEIQPVAQAATFFTDADIDLKVNGNTYLSSVGFDLSSVQVQTETNGSSAELILFLGAPSPYTVDDILAGHLDQAVATVSVADYLNPGNGAIVIYSGKVGQITCEDNLTATLQIGSILDQYVQICPDVISYTCRADLGDAKCKIDLTGKMKNCTVTASPDGQLIQTDLTDADKTYDAGLIVFQSGECAGISIEIGSYLNANGQIVCKLPLPYLVAPGDEAIVYPGCDKLYSTCLNKWNNALNFRGEPVGLSPLTSGGTKLPTSLTQPKYRVSQANGQVYAPTGLSLVPVSSI